MHIISTDLDFQRITVRTDHRRMEGLVHVRFRHRNVILDAGYQHPDCKKVEYLVELLMLLLHLLIDAVYVLRPAGQLTLESRLSHFGFDTVDGIVDDTLPFTPLLLHHADDLEILLRLDVSECSILKLPLDA